MLQDKSFQRKMFCHLCTSEEAHLSSAFDPSASREAAVQCSTIVGKDGRLTSTPWLFFLLCCSISLEKIWRSRCCGHSRNHCRESQTATAGEAVTCLPRGWSRASGLSSGKDHPDMFFHDLVGDAWRGGRRRKTSWMVFSLDRRFWDWGIEEEWCPF